MIYLASTYTVGGADEKLRQRRYEYAAKRAAAEIQAGHFVFSPIVHSHPLSVAHGLGGSYEFWKAIDRDLISRADAVWVLKMPRWEESVGITDEIAYAERIHIPVHYLEADDYVE